MLASGNTGKQEEKALFEGNLKDVKYCVKHFTGVNSFNPQNNFYEVDSLTTHHSTEEKPEAWMVSSRAHILVSECTDVERGRE